MNLDELVIQFKKSVVDLGTKGVMTLLIAEVPALGLPVIRGIVELFVRMIVKLLVNDTELGVYFVYTDQRTSLQAKAFEDAAAARLKVEADEKASEEEKKNAEQAMLDAARRLIRLGR